MANQIEPIAGTSVRPYALASGSVKLNANDFIHHYRAWWHASFGWTEKNSPAKLLKAGIVWGDLVAPFVLVNWNGLFYV